MKTTLCSKTALELGKLSESCELFENKSLRESFRFGETPERTNRTEARLHA
jgi:hypothetical protein